jgi:hypothetical protein
LLPVAIVIIVIVARRHHCRPRIPLPVALLPPPSLATRRQGMMRNGAIATAMLARLEVGATKAKAASKHKMYSSHLLKLNHYFVLCLLLQA